MPGQPISSGARRKLGRLRPGLPGGSPSACTAPHERSASVSFRTSADGSEASPLPPREVASPQWKQLRLPPPKRRSTQQRAIRLRCRALQVQRSAKYRITVIAPAGAGEELCSRTRAFLQGTRSRSWQLHAQAEPRERGRRGRGVSPGHARKMRPPVYAAFQSTQAHAVPSEPNPRAEAPAREFP